MYLVISFVGACRPFFTTLLGEYVINFERLVVVAVMLTITA